jgi:hypothetical protein
MELEWVFFSVTPTFGKTSRISLLFTSSSRAKSLIRIFIRLFVPSVESASRQTFIATSRFRFFRQLTLLAMCRP